MTCRSARCSATWWRRSRAGRAKSISRSPALAVIALAALAVLLAYDRRVAIIYVAVAAGVFVTLRLVAALLMLAARHAPRARSTVLRMAVANIHRPGALTPTIVLSLGLGIALAGHRDRDRRQSAPAIRRRAAGQGAVVLFPRHSVGPGRTLRCLRARASAGRDAGGSADAARAHRLRQRHPGGKSQTERGRRLGAAKRPRHHLWRRNSGRLAPGRGQMVGSRLRRAAAGLVREEDRRRPWPQARRPGHRQRARPQHHRQHRQYAHGRLAEPRHQFRDGVFAARLRRRAAHPSRHPHLSRRRHAGAGRRHHPRGRRQHSPWSPPCG